MLGLEEKKQQEIKHMVTILEQIDLPDILLLARDAIRFCLDSKKQKF